MQKTNRKKNIANCQKKISKVWTITLLILFAAISCNRANIKESATHKQTFSLAEEKIQEPISDTLKQNFLNTTNIQNSPVKIISSKLLKNQYSEHKDIELIYKNVSKKKITAIRFEWYCENAFNKPANGKFFFVKGKAEGYTNKALKTKESRSEIWEDFSTDAKTIISARAYFVSFSDGTNWKLN